ncbi:type VI secretion system membrane subunit TssM [Mesorhizobium sp. BAC0120]|uniref:type VI secretion system membrane subunit TssM n=1 Tax=Mesorhizobium sp. BAC0120 TaxID=3090670 RepID=UPI00298BD024|nr:type VI secretion system membrane subunit TssM [Mesorhizobium sp. BAC0120]MDW6026577.1 type VI secretion system membrane subunit TssM [Mesorhizobium sp. BAC0120]
MNFRALLTRWFRKAPVPVGLLCFALAVWFGGPMLGIGDSRPLDPVWIRVTIIAVAVVLVGLFYAIRYWRKRRAEKAIEAALKTDDSASGDGEVLAQRMGEAIDTLKRSSGKQTFLYELPWYVIIGPPGAGKTTALVNSGLKFPLAGQQGAAAIAGVGGTRYCDFWFTEDAVLIDTAGRYTTQDSDAETDRKSWLSFLSLLKQSRARQPINGVILAISVEDLLTESPEELQAHANAIRKRLFELNQELKIDFPVYALFTKADLIEGFREYFENFTENRRRKVWGHTFQTEDRKKNMVAQVPVEFDALVRRLTEELPDRLHEEPDGIARIAIFGFPAQFAGLRDRVAEFLNRIFEPTRYQTNANLRGFYFSSGTQEGTPIDQVLGAIGRNLAVPQDSRHLSGRGKSFFLHDLLRNVIFSESGWVSLDKGAVRRAAILRYGTMAVIGVASLATLGAWGWSYASNKALIASVDAAIGDYRVAASDELSRTEISGAEAINGDDLASIATYLARLRVMPAGYATRDAATPLGETFGLSQRGLLTAASQTSYRNALERMLRSRLILRLEQQIADKLSDPMRVYEALKVYLMLGGKAPKVDEEYVTAWMTQDWQENLLPGRANDDVRKELIQNLHAMLDLGRSHNPAFELNGELVTGAQAAIARMKMADRAYALIKSSAYSSGLTDFDIAMQSGADAKLVFETRDGSDLSQVRIPGLYSYVGFHEFFFKKLGAVAAMLESEHWVMGDAGKQSGVEDQFGRLGPELLDIYSHDFIDVWERTLDNLKLKSVSEDKPDYQVLAALSSDATSPLRQLLESIKSETALTQERDEPKAEAGAAAPAQPAAEAVKALTNQTSGLERIGINLALKKSQVRAGEANTGAAAATNPGSNIEAYFKPYHNWVEGSPGARPIDQLLKNLNDIRENLLVAANYPSQAGPANEKLRLQVVNLRGTVSRLPKPFARMISEVSDEFEGAEAGSTKAQMNQALANVAKICQRVTAGKYPFARESDKNAQIGEFAQLFGPNGLMDKYFADYLLPIVDISGSNWTWHPDSRLGQELSLDTLKQFQRAADIRNAFFPDGGPTPNIQLTIAPNTISKDADMALLEVNQIVLQTSLAGNAPASFTWPGNGGSGTANVSLYPELPGRESRLGREGPWALMRLIDAGSVSKKGEELIARFVIGGREVSYKIRVGSSYNPLFLPALGDFKCPVAF